MAYYFMDMWWQHFIFQVNLSDVLMTYQWIHILIHIYCNFWTVLETFQVILIITCIFIRNNAKGNMWKIYFHIQIVSIICWPYILWGLLCSSVFLRNVSKTVKKGKRRLLQDYRICSSVSTTEICEWKLIWINK